MLVPQEGVSCAVSQPGSAMGASEERSGERPEGRLCWQSQPQEIVRVTQSELSGSPNAWWAGQDRLSRTENKGVVFLSLPTDWELANHPDPTGLREIIGEVTSLGKGHHRLHPGTSEEEIF